MKHLAVGIRAWPDGLEYSLEIKIDMTDPAARAALDAFARCPWECPHCKALSHYTAGNCRQCGAARQIDDDTQEDGE